VEEGHLRHVHPGFEACSMIFRVWGEGERFLKVIANRSNLGMCF